jgi:hypothetical protein
MKKMISSVMAVALMTAAGTSMAWWDSDDDYGYGGPWGGDWNPYDEWDPRYWMEEMEQEFDDDDDWRRYGGYGYGPYGGGGYPYGGGYGNPYGGGYAPYGGGYAPYGGGYAPQQAPQQAPAQQQQAPAQQQQAPAGGGYGYPGYGY